MKGLGKITGRHHITLTKGQYQYQYQYQSNRSMPGGRALLLLECDSKVACSIDFTQNFWRTFPAINPVECSSAWHLQNILWHTCGRHKRALAELIDMRRLDCCMPVLFATIHPFSSRPEQKKKKKRREENRREKIRIRRRNRYSKKRKEEDDNKNVNEKTKKKKEKKICGILNQFKSN